MTKRKQNKKRLSAGKIIAKVNRIRKVVEEEFGTINWEGTKSEFGDIIANLIDKELITHSNGTDSYHFGLIMACFINIKRANGKREKLKHTAIYNAIKIGKSNINSEK